MKQKNTSQVVIAVFTNGDKILIEKRALENFTDLQHLIPGGEVEIGESVEQALKREVMEELGVTISEFIPLPASKIRGLRNQLLVPFLITKWEGNLPDFILDKKDPLSWLTIDEVLQTKVEPTRKIAEALKKYLENDTDKS